MHGARGMLGWSREELAVRAKVSPRTILRFESGYRQPYDRTLRDIVRVLEDAGIEFLEAQEGIRGPGIAFKWGMDVPLRAAGAEEGSGEAGEKASKAARDDFQAGATVPADAGLAEWWATRPELWDSLSPLGSEALSLKMFGHAHAGEGFFAADGSAAGEESGWRSG